LSGLLHCTYLKGIFGFPFWTFINVQNQKPIGGFENRGFKTGSEHNALKLKKSQNNLLPYFFVIFEKNRLLAALFDTWIPKKEK
jgi:hypothetical protein